MTLIVVGLVLSIVGVVGLFLFAVADIAAEMDTSEDS